MIQPRGGNAHEFTDSFLPQTRARPLGPHGNRCQPGSRRRALCAARHAGGQRGRVEPVDGWSRRHRVHADRTELCRGREPLRRNRRLVPLHASRVRTICRIEVGWMMWFTRVASWAAVINVLVSSLGFYWPAMTAGWPRDSADHRHHRRSHGHQHPRNSTEQFCGECSDVRQARAAVGLRRDGIVLRRVVSAAAGAHPFDRGPVIERVFS